MRPSTSYVREYMGQGPIFIAGLHRSGTTLLNTLVGSHPNIATSSVEPNMWTDFYMKYGSLAHRTNFDSCFANLLNYKSVKALKIDPEPIRQEFWQGAPTYGRLFALFLNQFAQQQGKKRWGDKSPGIEIYANEIFTAYPNARILHLIRDPRDRYMSIISRRLPRNDTPFKQLGRAGTSSERWLRSVRLAEYHMRKYPAQYKLVQYETLVRHPENVLREICTFIEEPYMPVMLKMEGNLKFRNGGNSSFIKHKVISTASVGRYQKIMPKRDLVYMQNKTSAKLAKYNYEKMEIELSLIEKLHLFFIDWPMNRCRISLADALRLGRNHFPVQWRYLKTLLQPKVDT